MNRKIAIVTGGSRGLGKNTALKLAEKGIDVIVTYHTRSDDAKAVVADIEKLGRRAVALQLDVSSSKTFSQFAVHVQQALQHLWQRATFDFLINNAGQGIAAPFAELTEEQFDQLMNTHLKGTFFLTQRLLHLISDGGRIINMSSGLTRFSFPGYSAYAAMKGGIEVLTKYMVKELGPRGISVNVVAPGAIATDFGDGSVRDNPDINNFIGSQTALGRAGVPDDIGCVIAALVADDMRWVNAQRIEISGGMLL
ncbi:MAG: fabG 3 [Verrucomicrobiaceae bacterium]|nr:fabG 3 [Verrucomicrobiaceae bacterium]